MSLSQAAMHGRVGHARRSQADGFADPPARQLHETREASMASIRKEVRIEAPAQRVWDALRDVGALHTRLVPGFVTDTQMEGNTRIVTFGNGMTAREEIVGIDDAQHRVS